MTTSTFANETIDQELSIEELQEVNGGSVLAVAALVVVAAGIYYGSKAIDDVKESTATRDQKISDADEAASDGNSTSVWAGPEGKGCNPLPF